MSPLDTVFPADSVEFCPHPSFADIFACGTYQLEQPDSLPPSPDELDEDVAHPVVPRKQQRKGECLLLRAQTSDDGEQLSLLHKTSLPAILDMKWCHLASSIDPTLAIADSEGSITLHSLRDDELTLERVSSVACAPKDVLCLSLDWSNRRSQTTSLGSLIVSLSDGRLALLQDDGGTGLTVTNSWSAHEYEPWIAAWNYWDTNVVYSGGDDLKMKAWDIRSDASQPIFTNKRFDAGVTTIQSNPHIEHIIAVGSYDNTVRLFDARKPLTPLTQAEVGGGAWRVKWHPSPTRQNDLLVACMHDGFKVVRFNFNGTGNVDLAAYNGAHPQQWEITARFDEHESLAYGVDWSYAGEGGAEDDTLIASCSFYDHALQLWRG
ncbi:hypothetical protein POSPLADRAFT_1042785 [Postia placenta MAD-698-R-SB12]|uniref:methylated diphthine methylhydrolase n=1 Tax=Postia placenta MAD-698-R-SB12 TaxID=670580 RepID=A0A1X6NGS8_9APHY|nr:hypothetical protein POSPLADRAFT_1042785 [Postia placenta MAD-698-R-SB12]OSX67573.1 hypothetical protein POSPLADRAFT_1042785 [Postia placenta MAD-698-R-SB12]